MADLPIQSAKFKKDLVVVFAFGLFFFTMAAELILAVLIPYHLRFDNVWQTSIARQHLFTTFDHSRNIAERIHESGSGLARDENALLSANYDRLAGYLHQHKKDISAEQCKELLQILQTLNGPLMKLYKKNTFTHDLDLNSTAVFKKMAGTTTAPAPAKTVAPKAKK